uniref:Uncharacterized protein n=1 Tax=Candidatus Kentrum sp. LPFa TaxID=2126335 RepID=A0A450X759_9GAMM|nr:MAG: hypothetical protein BECKLPF1236A_GA0070988_1001831 [Candidatus Kentron sp. LPFa]VFK25116.1 MAG: hypothetical protein BECKLPF1236C_GA0070990_100192 [Candidatus Kentron sp. LPFa]
MEEPTRAIARRPVQLPRYSVQSTGNLGQLHCGLGGLPGAPGNYMGMLGSCAGWAVERLVVGVIARGGWWSIPIPGSYIGVGVRGK